MNKFLVGIQHIIIHVYVIFFLTYRFTLPTFKPRVTLDPRVFGFLEFTFKACLQAFFDEVWGGISLGEKENMEKKEFNSHNILDLRERIISIPRHSVLCPFCTYDKQRGQRNRRQFLERDVALPFPLACWHGVALVADFPLLCASSIAAEQKV